MLDPSNISFFVTLLIKQPPLLYVHVIFKLVLYTKQLPVKSQQPGTLEGDNSFHPTKHYPNNVS